MRAKTKCLLAVGLFMLLEFLPFPVLGFVLLYVILNRPAWFRDWVEGLYREG
jgi:hypothetical protein